MQNCQPHHTNCQLCLAVIPKRRGVDGSQLDYSTAQRPCDEALSVRPDGWSPERRPLETAESLGTIKCSQHPVRQFVAACKPLTKKLLSCLQLPLSRGHVCASLAAKVWQLMRDPFYWAYCCHCVFISQPSTGTNIGATNKCCCHVVLLKMLTKLDSFFFHGSTTLPSQLALPKTTKWTDTSLLGWHVSTAY